MRRSFLLLPLLIAACHRDQESSKSTDNAITNAASLTEPTVFAPATGPSPADQSAPVVATDGRDFLAAWTETIGTHHVVRAGRIDGKTGALLDDRSLIMPSAGEGEDSEPAIAFDGTSYLVAWSHRFVKSSDETFAFAGAARISPSGKLLDEKAITLGMTTKPLAYARFYAPAVTFNGKSWVVAWSDNREKTPEVYAARLDADGHALGDATGTRVTNTGTDDRRELAIASVGDTSLVVFNEIHGSGNYDLFGVRIGAEGEVLDTTPIRMSPGGFHQYQPTVASNGESFLVTWNDYNSTIGMSGTRGQRLVDTQGGLIGKAANDLSPMGSGRASLAWDGASWVVATGESLNRAGKETFKVSREIKTPEGQLAGDSAVAVAGDSLLVLRRESALTDLYVPGSSPLVATLYGKNDAVVREKIQPARTDAMAHGIVSARNGDEQLVVWSEYRTDWQHQEVRGAIRKADGTVANPEGFLIRSGDFSASDASVVFDGSEYFVAWTESVLASNGVVTTARMNLGSVRVSPTGEVGKPSVSTGGMHIDLVAANSDVIGLVDGRKAFRVTDGVENVYVGTPLFERAANTSISQSAKSAFVYDGTNFVVAYGDVKTKGEFDLRVQQFGADGTGSNPRKITTIPIRNDYPNFSGATDGAGKTFIAWDDNQNATGISGVLISSDKVLGSGSLVTSVKPMGSYEPFVAWDGLNWLVAYGTRDNYHARDRVSALSLARVRLGATGLELLDTSLEIAPGNAFSPTLSTDETGHAAVAYLLNGVPQVRGFNDIAGPPLAEPTPEPEPKTPKGTTAPPGDDDDDSAPTAPTTKEPAKKTPKTSTPSSGGSEPSGATPEAPVPAAPTTITRESGGCSSAPGERSNLGALLLGAAVILVRRRRR